MSNEKTVWMRVYAPGGVISPHDLRVIAGTSNTLGYGMLRAGLRQDILVPNIPAMEERRFCSLISPMKACIYSAENPPNITSSYAAAELGNTTPWADSDTYQNIIKSFDFQPWLRVNVADPRQNLFPVGGGDINFIASKTEDVWHVVLHLPYMNEAQRLPAGIEGERLAEFVRDVERIVLGEDEPTAAAILESIRQKWKKGLVVLDEDPEAAPPAYGSYGGFHAMPKGGGQWLGTGARDALFDFYFVDEICRMAVELGVATLGISPWNALLVKNIRDGAVANWKTLLSRHGIAEQRGHAELWFTSETDGADARARKSFSEQTGALCAAAPGLSFTLGDFSRAETAVLIRRIAKPAGVFWRKESFTIFAREKLDRRSAQLNLFAEKIPAAEVPARLAELTEKFRAEQIARTQAVVEAAKKENGGPHYQCPDCLTRYDRKYGDPENGVVAGTPFADVPPMWQCPLCETAKNRFAEVA